MSSGIRYLKRSVIKHELGTNSICNAYHDKYGFHKQKTKMELKIEKAIERQKRREARKRARAKRIEKLFGKDSKKK